MPLYTDSDQVTTALLQAIDSEVAEVAAVSKISLEGPGSVARNTWSECANILLEYLTQFTGDVYIWPGAISYSGFFSNARPRIRLNNVLIGSPYAEDTGVVLNWMLYKALTLVYEQAAGRLKGDRYETQRAKYEKAAKRVWRSFFQQGLPLCAMPLSAPGASHDPLAGAWLPNTQSEPPTGPVANPLASAPGGFTNRTQSLAVAMTWVDQTQYQGPRNTGNAESAPCTPFYMLVQTGYRMTFDWSGLQPPGALPYQGGVANGIFQTRIATGVNIYAGYANGPLFLQNNTPLALNETPYSFGDEPITTGARMAEGQAPDARLTLQTTLARV